MKQYISIFLPPKGEGLISHLQALLFTQLKLWSAAALPPYVLLDRGEKVEGDKTPLTLPLSLGPWQEREAGWGINTLDAKGKEWFMVLAPKSELQTPPTKENWDQFIQTNPIPPRLWTWGSLATLALELKPSTKAWDEALYTLENPKILRVPR